MIVIASIHQPSTSTFELFDKVLLLSQGKVCYAASVPGINPYFENLGLPIPVMKNPAEHLLEITNIDFWKDKQAGARLLARIQQAWIDPSVSTTPEPSSAIQAHSGSFESDHRGPGVAEVLRIPVTLLHRLLLKSYRDIVTYWIRLVMYLGLAIIMGTVWLRLKGTQDGIQPFINAIVSHTKDSVSIIYLTVVVLRLSLHVFHGRCVRPGVPRRLWYICQGASQWSLRPDGFHDCQFFDWITLLYKQSTYGIQFLTQDI